MKKSLLLFATVLALGSCAGTKQSTSASPAPTGINPNENREEKSPTGETILIGPTTRVAFDQAPHSAWFHPGYQRYTPNAKIMEELTPLLETVTFKAYMGSWCIDSQRDVPRFFKVLDMGRVPLTKLEMVSLREDKSTWTGEEKQLNISAVPTFIVYKDGKELGRIVEVAYPTIEMQLLNIIKGTEKK
ncbi:thioredoxin family protein [Rufibacter sp. DG15C]|uniref:thioredoxin family protein n=1 Tax=Rufibacter sp. DG15C TaxID=1379909 RepID=UPI000AE3EC9F|nr:thioredoxin family protein [Rufibacter sp. DG15C]